MGAVEARQATQRHCGRNVGGGSCPQRGVTAHLALPRCSCHYGSYGEGTSPELVLESCTHPRTACDPDGDCESSYFPGRGSLWKHGGLALGSLAKLWVLEDSR